MKAVFAPITREAITQPSMNMCGSRAGISRSLKVPGSDSSAFATR
jgi:hypothetical protein